MLTKRTGADGAVQPKPTTRAPTLKSNLLRFVEKEVKCIGLKDTGISVVLKTRSRDPENHLNDRDADNECAVVVTLRVKMSKPNACKLEDVPEWQKTSDWSSYVFTVDTWIDSNADNARTLMKLYAETLAKHISRKILDNLDGSLYNGFRIKYRELFNGVLGDITKIENYILTHQETLVKQYEASSFSILDVKILRECFPDHRW
ncbi:hypothetical protein KKB44_06135 [Candidatus Micrarchaeota archaeon]|nr:hypothetical protein [Candidatus Micrarchaeota archaeon]